MKRLIHFSIIVLFGGISFVYGQNRPGTKTKLPAKPQPGSAIRPDKSIRYTMTDEKTEDGPSVGTLVKAIGDRIYLRWVPTMPSYWEFGYRDGYVVERINLKTKQRIVLASLLKPRPASEWVPFLTQKDRNYTLLHAAIFEKQEYSKDVLTQLKERRQLFHFSLFCADMDFKAACMAGLGLIDSTAVSGERYQYVISHKSATRYHLLSGLSAEVGLGDANVLPAINHLSGNAVGRVVGLRAAIGLVKKMYAHYQIERATDSVHYTSISDLPVVASSRLDTLIQTDSLTDDAVVYQYRIRGVTVFQEAGPYSNPIYVQTKRSLPRPEIYSARETDDKKQVNVMWLYKDSLSEFVDHYRLVGSPRYDGPFVPLQDSIPAAERHAFIKPIAPQTGFTFYIKLITYPKRGPAMETLVYPVTLADDDPPVKPKGLTGTMRVVGELGIVTLNWQPNPDADLQGYYVHRRDQPNGEMYRVNNSFIQTTSLTDTIQLRQVQRKVYYSLSAMDFLVKESAESDVLVLKVPDIIPPTSPIIDSFAVADRKIFLHWTRSHSDDVVKHVLYRKKMPTATWQELLTITDTLTQEYTDSSVEEKSLYAYTLIVFDDSQNRSQPATPVVLETPFFTRNVDFSQFTSAVVDTTRQTIRLAWTCNQTDKIDHFLIYRALPDDELALVKKLDGTSREWMDFVEMLPNKPYRYVIRARMQEGYLSGWKETVIERKP